MPEEGSEEDEYDEAKLIREWKPWRVRFMAAWFLCAILWHNPDHLDLFVEERREAYVDAQGILQMAFFEHSEIDLPDFDNRAPYGPGTERPA
jgi:hypothetical protein